MIVCVFTFSNKFLKPNMNTVLITKITAQIQLNHFNKFSISVATYVAFQTSLKINF